jgi:hypothetical protein
VGTCEPFLGLGPSVCQPEPIGQGDKLKGSTQVPSTRRGKTGLTWPNRSFNVPSSQPVWP